MAFDVAFLAQIALKWLQEGLNQTLASRTELTIWAEKDVFNFQCEITKVESRFFEPSDSSNQKSFPSPPSDTVILVTPDFSKYPIFRTNFRFPLRFEKFEFNCNFGMIIRPLDVRIGSVFVFTAILARLYNTCFRALRNFFGQ